jgi:hypothetical protein
MASATWVEMVFFCTSMNQPGAAALFLEWRRFD